MSRKNKRRREKHQNKDQQRQPTHHNKTVRYEATVNTGPNSYANQIKQAKEEKRTTFKKVSKESIFQVAEEIFGSRYFCIGDRDGVEL